MAPFRRYAHPFEKRVNALFQKLRASTNPEQVHAELMQLMQRDLIIVNLWMERRYKNYTRLTTGNRKRLYANASKIAEEFAQFEQQIHIEPATVQALFQHGGGQSLASEQLERLQYMQAIMHFLRPGERYQYLSTASFDKLLRDPRSQTLEGDCNQIVTLYAHLYSRKYPIQELQIKLLPDHICLNLFGIDIEATNATWQYYTSYEYMGPITELLAVNMLDVTDQREQTGTISEKQMAQASKLAYHLSSNRAIVEKNLRIAFHNLALKYNKQRNYTSALYYAKESGNPDLIKMVYKNAALAALKSNNFKKAHYYAAQMGDTVFSKAVYQQEYIYYQKKLPGNLKTVNDHKKHRSTYERMRTLAHQAGLREQSQQLDDLLRNM